MRTSNNELSNKRKDRVSFWMVFSLILNGYASGIPGVSLGSFVFILLIVYSLISNIKKGQLVVNSPVFIFGILLTVSSEVGHIIFTIKYSDYSAPLGTQIVGISKLWVWILIASITVKKYYDRDLITKWFFRFSMIMTVYIVFQSVLYYGPHIYLPNIFEFGPLQPYVEGYANYERLGNAVMLRPAGLLSESSFYGNFIFITTALYLEKNISVLYGKKLLFVLFLSFGIILSGSTSAIIFQAFLLFVYLRRIKTSRTILAILLLVIIVTAGSIVLRDFFESSFIGRTLNYSFRKFDYLDRSTRFGKSYGYLSLISKELLGLGVGIGEGNYLIKRLSGIDVVYLNSLTSLIVESGIVGCFLFSRFILKLLRMSLRTNSLTTMSLIACYFVKGVASGIWFSTYGVIFMYVIIGQLYYNNLLEPYSYDNTICNR